MHRRTIQPVSKHVPDRCVNQTGSDGGSARFSACRSTFADSAPEPGEKNDDSDRTEQEPGDGPERVVEQPPQCHIQDGQAERVDSL